MSKQADINIEIDKRDLVFTAGSVISGNVTVSPLESIECRNIVVSILWSTHGKGNRDKKELDSLALGPLCALMLRVLKSLGEIYINL